MLQKSTIMRIKKIVLFFVFALWATQFTFSAGIAVNSNPVIGGQVIIEKGQTREEIESLFVLLEKNNMDICRIRMFESYMNDGKGNWDFSTFDMAFEAAQRHGVTIIATLFPITRMGR